MVGPISEISRHEDRAPDGSNMKTENLWKLVASLAETPGNAAWAANREGATVFLFHTHEFESQRGSNYYTSISVTNRFLTKRNKTS